MNQVSCVNCGDSHSEFILDFASGDYICSLCGCVQPEQVIDSQKDWPDYDEEKGESNAHAEKVDEFGDLGTQIPTGILEEDGSRSSKYTKVLTKEERVSNHVKFAFSKVNELCETLQIPSIVKQTAKGILKQFFEKGSNLKGLKTDAFIVAVLLIASKQEQGARSLKTLARQTNIHEKDIKRFYKVLIKGTEWTSIKEMSHQVSDMIEQFCNRLQISYSIIKGAKAVAESIIPFLEGKRASSIATTAILFIVNLRGLQKTYKQSDLCAIAGISVNTLRNVYKEVTDNIDKIPARVFSIEGDKHQWFFQVVLKRE